MDGKSLNILSDKLNKLKEIVPEAFTEDKVDWEKLKAALGDDINFENERYHLNWAGKSAVFRVLQERTSATLKPVKEESVNFDETENVIIEGENLEVLKVLQKSYFNKIKMIYIDPPYNTGNDSFIYPDKFSESKDEYLKRIGDKSEDGYLLKEGFFRKNSKDSGHYHSNWLSMMYPRLYIARNLLRDDGVIFVSIDDNEVHNLRMIMNEIFGEENFIASIIRRTKSGGGSASYHYAIEHDYILLFAKNKVSLGKLFLPHDEDYIKRYSEEDENGRYFWDTFERSYTATTPYKIFAPDGSELNGHWFRSEERFKTDYEKGEIRILKKKNGSWSVQFKQREAEGKKPRSILNETEFKSSQEDLEKLNMANQFSFPKTSYLIKHLIQSGTEKEGVILDYFAGSGTTAQAVLELNIEDGGNRKFILVQLPEKTAENSEAFKAGYKNIADMCKERVRRVIYKLNDEREATQKEVNSVDELIIKKESDLAQIKKDKPELFENQKPSKEIQNIVNEIDILNQKQNEKRDQSEKLNNCDKGFKFLRLSSSNFKHWRSDIIESEEDLNKMIDMFDSQLKPGAQEVAMLYELMLKSGYILTDRVEKKGPSSPAGEAGASFYLVAEKLAVVLNKIDQSTIDEILKSKPQTCIILDNLFSGNDQLKTNTALQMKDAGVEMVVV